MTYNLRNCSFIKLLDFNQRELRCLLALSRDLKRAKYAKTERQHLKGKNIALVFEKDSTRTRCAFEVAAFGQGANVSYLGPSGTQLGHKESMQDTARVLGRMYDAIEYRGYDQSVVEELAQYAGVPVYNGLTDEFHPTQILADFLTMQEYTNKPLHEISFCFVGNADSNVAHSLMLGACIMGMDVRLAAPRQHQPDAALNETAVKLANRSGARLRISENARESVQQCDFIYTDVWVSMGDSDAVWSQRIDCLLPFQVDAQLMLASGNAQIRFMHCLPALHNRATDIGAKIYQEFGLQALEVTNEVFESDASIVFVQAENRLHTIKAVLVATLGE